MLTRIKYAGEFFDTSTPKQNCSFHRMTALLRPRLPLNVHFVVIQFVFDRTQDNQAFHVDTPPPDPVPV